MKRNAMLNQRRNNRALLRANRGSSLLELVAMMWLLIPFSLVSLNCGTMALAAWMNSAACRQAARAAADQANAPDAKAAAVGAAKAYAVPSGLFASSPTVLLSDKDFQFQTFDNDNGSGDPDKQAYVRVTTRLVAKIPAPVSFAGIGFPDKFTLTDSNTYPVLHPDKNSAPIYDLNVQDEPEANDNSQLGSGIAGDDTGSEQAT